MVVVVSCSSGWLTAGKTSMGCCGAWVSVGVVAGVVASMVAGGVASVAAGVVAGVVAGGASAACRAGRNC